VLYQPRGGSRLIVINRSGRFGTTRVPPRVVAKLPTAVLLFCCGLFATCFGGFFFTGASTFVPSCCNVAVAGAPNLFAKYAPVPKAPAIPAQPKTFFLFLDHHESPPP
jgi:hypothetical protein